MISDFYHSCGNILVLDFSQCFLIRSPSAGITSTGLVFTVAEFVSKPGKVQVQFYCTKCKETLPAGSEEITTACSCCRETKPLSEVFTCDEVPKICDSCAAYIRGDKKNPPEIVRGVMRFVKISKTTKLVALSTIVTSRISV